MSLHELQLGIAALACEDGEIESFARDRGAWTAARGLSAKEAMILRGIDPGQMRGFREIHARDRGSVLEGLFPRTLRVARAGTLEDYARVNPYGRDENVVEALAFEAHVRRTHATDAAQDATTRDLAKYEANWWRIAQAPPFEPRPHPGKGASAGLRLAAGLAAFDVETDIRPIIDGVPIEEIRRVPGVVLLRRDADGITSAWLEGAPACVLTDALEGETAADISVEHGPEGERALRELLQEGILL